MWLRVHSEEIKRTARLVSELHGTLKPTDMGVNGKAEKAADVQVPGIRIQLSSLLT